MDRYLRGGRRVGIVRTIGRRLKPDVRTARIRTALRTVIDYPAGSHDRSDLGRWQWNLSTDEFEANRRLREIFGFGLETPLEIADLTCATDLQAGGATDAWGPISTWPKIVVSSPFSAKFHIRKESTGEARLVESTVRFIPGSSGMNDGTFFGVVQDITDRPDQPEDLSEYRAKRGSHR